jgi:hypothetical protein
MEEGMPCMLLRWCSCIVSLLVDMIAGVSRVTGKGWNF